MPFSILEYSARIKDYTSHSTGICDRIFRQGYPAVALKRVVVQTTERNRGRRIDRVLSVSNVKGFIDQREQFEDRVIASEDISNYKIVRVNDFAYNPARINVGSIARLSSFSEGLVSPMYICFRCSAEIDPAYLECYLGTHLFGTEVEKRLEGSVRMCLSFDGLCGIPVPLPELEVQKRIAKEINTIATKVALEQRILDYYMLQKQFLLTGMFI